MASIQSPTPKLDRYIIIHVATTCDEHGVYVTKDSAEVIELGWILLDTKNCEEVGYPVLSVRGFHSPFQKDHLLTMPITSRSIERASW